MNIFYPDRMADRILGMGDVVSLVEKAQEKMDQEAAEKAMKHMMEGKFDLNDMLIQLEQTSKLGPLSGILKMLPGYSQYSDLIDEAKASDGMKKTKAIIQSMTMEERRNPDKIRSTMKKRIATGSGTSLTEVNKVLNQFAKTKRAMDAIGGMQKRGSLNEENLEKMMNQAQEQMDAYRSQMGKFKN